MEKAPTLTVAVYGSRHQGENAEAVFVLLRELSERGCRLLIHPKLMNHLSDLLGDKFSQSVNLYGSPADSNFNADLALSIGGDGTFLRTARWVADKEIPILAINTGNLGYLTAFDITETSLIADTLFSGKFKIENRSLLEIDVEGHDLDIWNYALNELAILRDETASMITVDSSLDGEDLASYLSDGLIVSTPTGSTGYNLSVGGPVVQPTSPTLVVAPVAPHSLTMRPIVIADSSELSFRVTARSETFKLSLDGNYVTLPCGVKVTAKKAPFVVRVIQRLGFNFADRLRHKLLWGVR